MHQSRRARTTATILLLAATLAGATPRLARALDNPPPGPTIDVDCTDPDTAITCRECSVDGPVFCCEQGEPCTIKPAPPKPQQLVPLPVPRRRGLGTKLYFTR